MKLITQDGCHTLTHNLKELVKRHSQYLEDTYEQRYVSDKEIDEYMTNNPKATPSEAIKKILTKNKDKICQTTSTKC
ncbi:MAG: hypothetical protein ACMV1B_00265 [Prevotella sp.]